MICFFKQKTAYEMRISDWSSDVCSSDLWPGNVKEEADLLAAAGVAQVLGQQHEVVVMHPDGVGFLQEGLQAVGEERVDALVAGPGALGELGKVEPVVKQRPERRVGEADVVLVVVPLGEIDGGVGDLAEIGRAHG